MEQKLWDAARYGHISEVSSLLRDHPEIDVNWTDNGNLITALHAASFRGHVEIVQLLFAHLDINVNVKTTDFGVTPLLVACQSGYLSVVQLLLKDPRVDVTQDDNNGRTPLWYASREGKHEVIEWFIASGRDLGDIENQKGKWMAKNTLPLKLQERGTTLKLFLCWKDSWQTQPRPGMKFV